MSRVHGIGLGLRAPLVADLLSRAPPELAWVEVSPENYMGRGGAFARHLALVRARWPVVTHGLTLSLGGPDPLDEDYLTQVRDFVREVGSPWHSDHLCFGSADGAQLHDLLPLPRTSAMLRHVASRIHHVQEALGVPLAIENVSAYAHPGVADFDEATMLRELVRSTGVRLLLDVNNVYVNACNHALDARAMIDALPLDAVVQLHVAGHRVSPDGLRIDTHGEPVCDEVFALLEHTLARTGPVPVLLERDQNTPPWPELVAELCRVDARWRAASARSAP